MRRSAIAFVLNSSTVDALLLMAHPRRFANMQDELAEFDALKGQIYTSPGQAQRRPGLRTQNDLSLFFPSSLAHRAKLDGKKRELGCEVSFTQGGGSAGAPLRRALPWADIRLPFPGAGPTGRKANKSPEATRVCGLDLPMRFRVITRIWSRVPQFWRWP